MKPQLQKKTETFYIILGGNAFLSIIPKSRSHTVKDW